MVDQAREALPLALHDVQEWLGEARVLVEPSAEYDAWLRRGPDQVRALLNSEFIRLARIGAAATPAPDSGEDILAMTTWPGYERHQHADGSWCQRKILATPAPDGGAEERLRAALPPPHMTDATIDAMTAALGKTFPIYADDEAGMDIEGDAMAMLDALVNEGFRLVLSGGSVDEEAKERA